MLRRLALLGACSLVTAAFAQQPADVDSRKISALCAQLAAEVRSRTRPASNSALQEYAERVGQRLGSVQGSALLWHFEVVTGLSDEPTHPPVPLPGGYIFIPERLFRRVKSEEEFAGMLAHAMARRFGTRSLASYGSTPLIFVGGLLDGSAVPLGMLPEQRRLELAADAEAVQIMRRAGYDPNALMNYLARAQSDDPGPMSPSPPRSERIAALQKAIADVK